MHLGLGIINEGAGRRAFGRLERAEGLELLGEHALASEPVHPQLFKSREAVAGADLLLRLLGQCSQVGHER